MRKTPDPEWYVYVIQYGQPAKYNVFHSVSFLEGCKRAFKKYSKNIDELKNEIKRCASYSFRSKFEYEILITPLGRPTNDLKISVYDQLSLNWDAFINYTIEHKAFFLRKETERK